jgi:hypothetical protein
MDAKLRGYLHVPRAYDVRAQIDLTGVEVMDLIAALESLLIENTLRWNPKVSSVFRNSPSN